MRSQSPGPLDEGGVGCSAVDQDRHFSLRALSVNAAILIGRVGRTETTNQKLTKNLHILLASADVHRSYSDE
jgi:hypothetical protein